MLQFNQSHYTEGTTNNKQKENGRRVIIISDRTFCFSCNFSPFLVMLFEIFYNLSIILNKKLHLIFRMLFYKECSDKLNARLMTKILGNIYWILSKCQSLCQVLYTDHFISQLQKVDSITLFSQMNQWQEKHYASAARH